MSEENQMPSGQADPKPVAEGQLDQASESSRDSVQYETYRKVLSEKKRRDEELAEARRELEEIRARDKANKEKELIEQNKWQEYAKAKEEEAKAAIERVRSYEEREIASRKLDRVLSGVGDPIDSKFWGLINIDSVAYNPESGEFDETSLNAEIQRIKTQMPEIITRRQNASFDASAPAKNGNSQIDLQKFASMSKAEKKLAVGQLHSVPEWMRGK
jgi:hypothetical protein